MIRRMNAPSPHGIRMVDVGDKTVSRRTARATARLRGSPESIRRILAGDLAKGDAISTARIAGIMAAKRTSDIIPLCHPLPIESVEIDVSGDTAETILIEAAVRATARTGVEMEALCAASAAALTIYDMTKSIDSGMTIEQVRLESKTGGTRGDYSR